MTDRNNEQSGRLLKDSGSEIISLKAMRNDIHLMIIFHFISQQTCVNEI